MEICVNGKEVSARDGCTLQEYLDARGFKGRIVTEYNGDIVEAGRWHEVILNPQDRLEIVTFVGGG